MPGLGSATGTLTVTTPPAPPAPSTITLTAPDATNLRTQHTYIAVASGNIYQFGGFLTNPDGSPNMTSGTYNSETVVYCNNDQSMQRGFAAGTPAGAATGSNKSPNVYDAYSTQSEWEKI